MGPSGILSSRVDGVVAWWCKEEAGGGGLVLISMRLIAADR